MIDFCKFHGFGNDYIVIERGNVPDGLSLSDLAVSICSRHTGAGADGIAVVEKLDSPEADYFCEIVNPDGSIAGFSGNGTRCAAAYLYYCGLWSDPSFRLKVRSGVKDFRLIERPADGTFVLSAEIGKPLFASEDVPIDTGLRTASVVDHKLYIGETPYAVSAVNVGNPVICLFVDDFDLDWRIVGRELEVHPALPERANVVFVKPGDRASIEIRIWERGAGETSSSGTCSAAAAVLSAFTGRTGRRVAVHAPGGTTDIDWRADDTILLTGRADLAYLGRWPA